jgi:WD40 repeat protein
MSSLSGAFNAGIVRLRDANDHVVGAGLLVSPHEIVTCAHVVARALGVADDSEVPSGASLSIDFPFVAPDQRYSAQVVRWCPKKDDGTGDIAGLTLSDMPRDVSPSRLIVADDLWGHSFRVLGFPVRHDDGAWATGQLRALQARHWLQMDGTTQAGYPIARGFSGAPVWDEELEGVVGITVAVDADPAVRSSYLIPAAVLIEAWPALRVRTIAPCPYRGLFAFREQDAALFYGREELTDQLLDAVSTQALVTVIGASGSGKSSLVFAGSLPRLRQRTGWLIATLRPAGGTSPLDALAAALLPLLEPEMTESQRLEEIPRLARLCREGQFPAVIERILAKLGGRRLVIIIDQFEETYALDPEVRRAFLDVLLQAIVREGQRSDQQLTLVLTIRADFLGQALAQSRWADAFQGTYFTVGPMTAEQLRRAITEPAGREVSYEAGLVERILDDVGDEPGNLPLLEFALTLLWERQRDGRVTHRAYEDLGRVQGAVAEHAEEVVSRLAMPAQDTTRRVLLQLVRPGTATDHTRRIATATDFDAEELQVVQQLAGARLVVMGRDPANEETVEIVHEALISTWSRLHRWIDEDYAFRSWQEELRDAIRQWEEDRQDEGGLLRGGRLDEAEGWLARRSADLTTSQREFIQTSRRLRERELDSVRRRNRQLRSLVSALSLLLVVALVSVLLAVRQTYLAEHAQHRAEAARGQAEAQSRLATTRQLAVQATTELGEQPQLALFHSLEASRLEPIPEARRSLIAALQQDPRLVAFLPSPTPISDLAFGDHGTTLSWLDDHGTLRSWDVKQVRPMSKPFPSIGDGVDLAWFSADGGTVVADVYSGAGPVMLGRWDVRRHALIGHGVNFDPGQDDWRIFAWSGSADARRVIFSTEDKRGSTRLWLWRTGDAKVVRLAQSNYVIDDMVMSPDGHEAVFITAEGALLSWDDERSGITQVLKLPSREEGYQLFFSPDDHTVAIVGSTITLWNSLDRKTVGKPFGDHSGTAAFSHDAKRLAVADEETNTIHVWNIKDRKEISKPLIGHAAPVTAIVFSSDNRLLAASSFDNTMILWNLQHRGRLSQTVPGFGKRTAEEVAVDQHGNLVAWTSEPGKNRQGAADVKVASWALHGRKLIAGPLLMELRDAPEGASVSKDDYTRRPISLAPPAVSPDGSTVATVVSRGLQTDGDDFTITLWDMRTRRLLRTLEGAGEFFSSVGDLAGRLRFSPDGLLLAGIMDDGGIHLWRTRQQTGSATEAADPIATIPPVEPASGAGGAQLQAIALAFTSNSKVLLSATAKGSRFAISFWDVRSNRRIQQFAISSPTFVTSWALSADGATIALGLDGTVLLIDRRTQRVVGMFAVGTMGPVISVAFDKNDQELIAVSSDSTIARLDVKVMDWQAEGCRLVKPLDQPEWRGFLPEFYRGNPCP